jgi:hypothetical protein
MTTKSKPTLPLTIPLQIPTWWTPREALAVFEMIDDLRSTIWKCYQVQLLTEYRDLLKEAAASSERARREELDLDDLPF